MSNRPTLTQLTDHARQRAQQRGIEADVLSALLRYGDVLMNDRKGARVLGFTHASRERLRRTLGRRDFARLADRLDVYAVVSHETGSVITVGHRLIRLHPRKHSRGSIDIMAA